MVASNVMQFKIKTKNKIFYKKNRFQTPFLPSINGIKIAQNYIF
jgi:hypothetical protein